MLAANKYDSPLFDIDAFSRLADDPEKEIQGRIDNSAYSAQIAIPHYGDRIERHYNGLMRNGLPGVCDAAEIPFDLDHFGLIIRFANPVAIQVHDDGMVLEDSIRNLVDRFGPVIFRNAWVDNAVRERFHRNIFPHLRFHVDRGLTMPNQYSCFTRDPFDAEQKQPRNSSTVFIGNVVAWLEEARLAGDPGCIPPGIRTSYDLFDGDDMSSFLGTIVLEQPWNEPAGTGEIAVIDNRTVLHATYHKDGETSGYPIGARYLI